MAKQRTKAERAAVGSEERQYWVQIPNEFFDLGLSPYELAAYAWMKRRFGTGKSGVFESVSNMAKAVGMSTRRFHTAIDRLMEANVIRSEGKTLTVKYIIHDKSVWKMPSSAPDAEGKSEPSAPHAEHSLHHVQKDSAPRADKVDTLSRYQEERKGTAPAAEPASATPKTLSFLDQLNLALAEPDTAEARAFLQAIGSDPDRRPLWELAKFLKRTLGTEYTHRQVRENLEAWAGSVTLADARAAWEKARARYKREPTGLKPILHFVDILNGSYKPDSHDLREAATASVKTAEVAAAAAPRPGDRVRLPDGTTDTVHDFDSWSNWVELVNTPAPFRPEELQVIQ